VGGEGWFVAAMEADLAGEGALKEVVAEQALELRLLKKSMIAAGDDRA
jgi:hypothetical protein